MKAASLFSRPHPALGGLLGLLILGWIFAPAAAAEVRPEVSYVYYQVPYLQGKSVVDMMNLSTPVRGSDGHRYRGFAKWWIRYNDITFTRPKIDVCRVAEPRVTCQCEITLPQLQGGDENTRRNFEKVTADLREHELEHCRIAASHADRVEQAFRDLKDQDCDKMRPALREISKKILDDCSVAQKRFDYAEYGYKQYLRAQSLQDLGEAGFNIGAPSAGWPRPAPQGQPTMTVLPQDNKEDLKREGIFQDENGVWRNY